jgi:hypothetical protein
MKKLISIALLLAMCLSLFAGCKNEPAETTSDLANAKAYLINMYQTSGKDEVMVLTTDKDVLAKVIIDGVSYERLAEEFDLSVQRVKEIAENAKKTLSPFLR